MAYKVRIPRLILNPDLVELDVKELVDTLERAGYAEIILEFYCNLCPSTSVLRAQFICVLQNRRVE